MAPNYHKQTRKAITIIPTRKHKVINTVHCELIFRLQYYDYYSVFPRLFIVMYSTQQKQHFLTIY